MLCLFLFSCIFNIESTKCHLLLLQYHLLLLLSCSVVSDSVRLHGLQHARLPCPSFTISRSFLKLMSIESVMPSNHLVICWPLLPPPSIFPTSGSFPMNQLFTSGGQRIGASASVLPVNIQDWFPLGLAGWISLQSKGLSRVFSNTSSKASNSLVLSILHGPTLISIHDY